MPPLLSHFYFLSACIRLCIICLCMLSRLSHGFFFHSFYIFFFLFFLQKPTISSVTHTDSDYFFLSLTLQRFFEDVDKFLLYFLYNFHNSLHLLPDIIIFSEWIEQKQRLRNIPSYHHWGYGTFFIECYEIVKQVYT